MNKIINSISIITLCAALGLPLAGYATCYKSLDITLINQSSHDLTINNTNAPCACAGNSDSMYTKYPPGTTLSSGDTWYGSIYVDTGSSCGLDPSAYDADFLDKDHGGTWVLHYKYYEYGGVVQMYDDIYAANDPDDPRGNPLDIYSIDNKAVSSNGCIDGNPQELCTRTAIISDK
jgi:hypothetical protein